PNMGDPDTLELFVEFVMETYPAANYMLDLWDHGSGWETYNEEVATISERSKTPTKGICYDDTNGGDALNTDELGDVLSNLPDKIDVLSFDACLMAAAELAYEYRNDVDYLVASEETIPGNGFNYELLYQALVNNPYMTPEQLSQIIVTKYSQAYATDPTTTLSAIDCSKMDDFAVALDTFAQAMIANMTSCVLGIFQAWMDVDYFTVLSYIELSHFCDLVIANVDNSSIITAANGVKQSIANAVISNHYGNNHPEAKGLSIYFPFLEAVYSSKYEERIDLTQATHWDEFLKAYWAAGGGGGISFQQYIIDDDMSGLSNGNDNGVVDSGEIIELSVTIRNNGLIEATTLSGMFLTSDDYVYYTTFFCDFTNLNPGETATSISPFILTIAEDTPASNYYIDVAIAIYSDQFGEQIFNNILAVGTSEVTGGGNFDEAIALVNGQTVTSTLNGTEPSECMWFKVDVEAGYRLLVTMVGESGTDFDLKIYSDYQAFLVGEGVLLSYPEVINIVSLKTSTYYIKVYSFEGAGEFSISIQMTETGGVNYGSNIGSTAIPVETGSYHGLLPGPSPWGTVFYRFDGQANKKCTFTLTGPAGSIYDMTLYDEQGNELTWTTTLTSNYPVVMEYELDYDGRYYLEIESYTGSGEYSIEFDIPQGFLSGIDYYYWIVIAIIVISVILSILQSKGII
ncbi:MAG: clostripain-related cysteine peptidase, partial [Candidatus Heimdallarchaeaceae archaeon]